MSDYDVRALLPLVAFEKTIAEILDRHRGELEALEAADAAPAPAEDHGAALVRVLREGLGYDVESRDYRVSREALDHAEALIADLAAERADRASLEAQANDLLARFTAERAAREKAEADLAAANERADKAEADLEDMRLEAIWFRERAEKAEADAAAWKERAERRKGALLIVQWRESGLTGEEMEAALSDDPPKEPA